MEQLTENLSLKDAIDSFPEVPKLTTETVGYTGPLDVVNPATGETVTSPGTSTAEQVETYDEQPEDAAARIYGELMVKFDNELHAVSKKGLQRILSALVKVPLIDINFKMDRVENNVCSIASKLLQCKSVMETSVMMDYLKAQEEKDAAKLVETSSETLTESLEAPVNGNQEETPEEVQ